MSAMKTAFGYIEKNPEEILLKLLGWVDKLAGDGPDSFPVQRAAFHSVLENPDSNMYKLIMKVFNRWKFTPPIPAYTSP